LSVADEFLEFIATVGGVVENHPDCALSKLGRVLAWSGHGLDPLSE
jgi:hypothetical protein